MNKKFNLLIIFLIFALPILFYFVTKSPKGDVSQAASAEAANKPKVLHFAQAMCSECRKLEAVMTPVEQEYKGKINFINIDVANDTPKNRVLIQKYKVRVVPTLVFIDKKGNVVNRTEGSMSKEELERNLNKICDD